MEDILIYSGVYGIMVLAVMNLLVIWIGRRRRVLNTWDGIWLTLFIFGISLLAAAVFFRNISKMSQWYYPLIFTSLLGLIGLLLRLTHLLRRRK